MNHDLLLQIADAVRNEPSRFDMADWFQSDYLDEVEEEYGEVPGELTLDECGTTCCVAGWAIHLDMVKKLNRAITWKDLDDRVTGSNYADIASELLGMDVRVGDRLFYTSAWPTWAVARYRRMEEVDPVKQADFVATLLEYLAKYEDLEKAWDELRAHIEAQDADAEEAALLEEYKRASGQA